MNKLYFTLLTALLTVLMVYYLYSILSQKDVNNTKTSEVSVPDRALQKHTNNIESNQHIVIDVIVAPSELKVTTDIVTTEQSTITHPVPMPDAIWEQQHRNSKSLYDLPATIPDMPVISKEQREVEAQALVLMRKSNTISTSPLPEPVYPYEESEKQVSERPPVEPTMIVIPFELQEIESNTNFNQGSYSEPLIDPETGLPDEYYLYK